MRRRNKRRRKTLLVGRRFIKSFGETPERCVNVSEISEEPNDDDLAKLLLASLNNGFRRYLPKRMPPVGPLPTSPLPQNIFNPETPRKTRVESDRSKMLDIMINLFNAPVCPITTPIPPTTIDIFFSIEPQVYSSPEASTPSTTPMTPTTDIFFSPNPQVYSPPEAFTPSNRTTTPTTTTLPIIPTTITPPITTNNDEEQVSTASSISDKKIRKKRKEPLRRSARRYESETKLQRLIIEFSH